MKEKTAIKWEKIWIRGPLDMRDAYPLMIKYAGSARCSKGWEVERERSYLFAVEYVCAGNAWLEQDNRRYVINKGEVYLLRKDVRHVYGPGPAGIVFKRYITIDGLGLENTLRYLNLWDKDHIVPAEPKKIEHLLKRFTSLLSNPPSSGLEIELSTMAYHLLLVLSESVRTRFPESIEHALECMHANLHRSLSRKEICDYVGTSIAQLNRMFAAYLHRSPVGYFIDLKMTWALNMIRSTEIPVKEIAYRIGFDNPFHFSTLFKKRFGVSPKIYRELKLE